VQLRAPERRPLQLYSACMSRGNLQSSLGAIFSHHSVAAGENSGMILVLYGIGG
jgi:hypothetical protein